MNPDTDKKDLIFNCKCGAKVESVECKTDSTIVGQSYIKYWYCPKCGNKLYELSIPFDHLLAN